MYDKLDLSLFSRDFACSTVWLFILSNWLWLHFYLLPIQLLSHLLLFINYVLCELFLHKPRLQVFNALMIITVPPPCALVLCDLFFFRRPRPVRHNVITFLQCHHRVLELCSSFVWSVLFFRRPRPVRHNIIIFLQYHHPVLELCSSLCDVFSSSDAQDLYAIT